ncbi:MAG TPA: CHAT domain-containing protein [Actinoplanes sp.]|nr:CHAT domain-containing protein [Actinoplanes sp.]
MVFPDGRTAGRDILAHRDDAGRWWPLHPDDPPDDADAFRRQTARVLAVRSATETDAKAYGGYLFDVFIGAETWNAVVAAAGGRQIELALRWPADDEDLQRHVWELLYDASGDGRFLARDEPAPVFVIRQISCERDGTRELRPTTDVPRLLFGVGAALTDPRIRAGAEVVGVLRGLQHGGGVVDLRAVHEMTFADLRREYRRFQPHVVHLVARPATGPRAVPRFLLHPHPGSDDGEVTAADLVAALAAPRPPRMVLLSICEDPAAERGTSLELAACSLGAQMVAAGVDIVVALSGIVPDLACRLFVRAFGMAVADGAPLVRATALARAAAFTHRAVRVPGAVDWALPVIFTASDVPEDFRPVDTVKQQQLRDRIERLEIEERPLLCDRDEYFTHLDHLLDPRDRISVLVVQSRTREAQVGGTRLLRDLAGAALRSGHVPCLVGPFPQDAPRSDLELALRVVESIVVTRAALGLDGDFPSRTVMKAYRELHPDEEPDPDKDADDLAADLLDELMEADTAPRSRPKAIAKWLRHDLVELIMDVNRSRAAPVRALPILLFDDVDRYGAASHDLCAMLGRIGLRATGDAMDNLVKIPVVLFAKEADDPAESSRLVEELAGRAYVAWENLQLFWETAQMRSTEDDLLAWRWLLLHPERNRGPAHVVTPRSETDDSWHLPARQLMRKSKSVYDAAALHELSEEGRHNLWFHHDDDAAILAGCDLTGPAA